MAKKKSSKKSTKKSTSPQQQLTNAVNMLAAMTPTYTPEYFTGTYNAQNYNGPTYESSEYVSNYKPQEYQGDYKPGEYTSNYKPAEFTDTYTPAQYDSKYMPQIEESLNKITNWSYDPLADANYQALAKVYGARGNIAAKNSLADAASLNGGYGTSHAVSAAQQARNQYNQELASLIPELEQNAYQRQQTGLSALMDIDNAQYGRFSDDQSRQLQGKQFGLDVAGYNEGNRQFGANYGLDLAKYNEGNRQFAEQNAQNVWGMNADDRYRAISNAMDIYGLNQGERQFAANYGLDAFQTNQSERQYGHQSGVDRVNNAIGTAFDYLNYANAQKAAKSGGGGGGGRRSSGGGGGYSSVGSGNSGVPISQEDFNKLGNKQTYGPPQNVGTRVINGARSLEKLTKKALKK